MYYSKEGFRAKVPTLGVDMNAELECHSRGGGNPGSVSAAVLGPGFPRSRE